jgi:hypothetical protein
MSMTPDTFESNQDLALLPKTCEKAHLSGFLIKKLPKLRPMACLPYAQSDFTTLYVFVLQCGQCPSIACLLFGQDIFSGPVTITFMRHLTQYILSVLTGFLLVSIIFNLLYLLLKQ